MNDLTNSIPSVPTATVELLERKLQALRKLFVLALAVLLVISGSLMIFLWGQKRILNGQLREVQKFVEDYEKVTAPFINNFVSNLQAYGRTHPDFNPILDKYKLRTAVSNAVPQVVQPTPPTPVPAAPKK